MQYNGATNEILRLTEVDAKNAALLEERFENGLGIIWNSGARMELRVDGKPVLLEADQMIFLNEFHRVEAVQVERGRLVRFNRPFFCVVESDSEVGCKGILFFAAADAPILAIPPEELEKYDILWRMFMLEMSSTDTMQMEMLQMMLRRMLILCTRLYKAQLSLGLLQHDDVDMVRQFNYLVETNYRTKHSVAQYAELLHRSPKTLANLFAQLGRRSPLKIIQERIMLEARRLVRYSDMSVKEIAFELGFEDLQTFSRFFKAQEGVSPSEFRAGSLTGTIANPSGSPAYLGP